MRVRLSGWPHPHNTTTGTVPCISTPSRVQAARIANNGGALPEASYISQGSQWTCRSRRAHDKPSAPPVASHHQLQQTPLRRDRPVNRAEGAPSSRNSTPTLVPHGAWAQNQPDDRRISSPVALFLLSITGSSQSTRKDGTCASLSSSAQDKRDAKAVLPSSPRSVSSQTS
ncbi:hypothetical protein ACJZ2D_008731 [Fusarium nematophilum]